MISPQIIQQIKDMFPDQAEELVLDKIDQLMETHPDTQESELIDIANQFRQLLDAETKGRTGQLAKLAGGQPEMPMSIPTPQATGLQKHFPNTPPEEVNALIVQLKQIVPTAKDADIINVADQSLTEDLSDAEKKERLIRAANGVANLKRQQKVAALQKKL